MKGKRIPLALILGISIALLSYGFLHWLDVGDIFYADKTVAVCFVFSFVGLIVGAWLSARER